MKKPIYLTTARLLYNLARIDFENGRITESELKKYKSNWELEYNNDAIQKKLAKKYSKRED